MTSWGTYDVYRIVCFPTGQVYVGMAQIVKTRLYQHWRELKKGHHHNALLQKAYNEYGRDAFFVEVLERDLSFDECEKREQYWIDHYNSAVDGFNLTFGGKTGFSRPFRNFRHTGKYED